MAKEKCWVCHGTGKCKSCGGKGKIGTGNRCSCNGGKCPRCNGTGRER